MFKKVLRFLAAQTTRSSYYYEDSLSCVLRLKISEDGIYLDVKNIIFVS